MAGQEWAVSALGGALTSETLSRNVRMAAQPKMRFRQLTRLEMAFGAHNGDTVTYKKFTDLEDSGRAIGEKEPVPETNFNISDDTITIREYSNSVPYTSRLSLLAKLSVEDMIIIGLMNDMAKTLDFAAAQQFRLADGVYVPTGTTTNKTRTFTTNATAGATATRNISTWDVRNIIQQLRSDHNCPAYDGNDYICVASSTFIRGLQEDADFVEAAKYGKPEVLFSGEVGKYYGCRFIEENHALNGNLSGGLGEAVFIGWDAVIEIVAFEEEIQAKIAGDWGRDKGLRWVWYGGYKKVHTFSDDGQIRMIRVYSA